MKPYVKLELELTLEEDASIQFSLMDVARFLENIEDIEGIKKVWIERLTIDNRSSEQKGE